MLLRAVALLLSWLLSVPAYAQAEYFTNGERVIAMGGLVQQNATGRSVGGELEAFFAQGVAMEIGYGSFTLQDGGEGRVSTLSFGINGYPSRQGTREPVTIAVGLNVSTLIGDLEGRRNTDGDVLLGAGFELVRAFTFERPSLHIAPSLAGVYTLSVHETDGGITSQVVSLGLGLGVNAARSSVFYVKPAAWIAFSQGEREGAYGFTFGFATVH